MGSPLNYLMLTLILLFKFLLVIIHLDFDHLTVAAELSVITDEQRLLETIMFNYVSYSTPPRRNKSQPVQVRTIFRLHQITDLEEKNQILTTNVFIEQKWFDSRLSWDSDLYNGAKMVRIPAGKVWIPDTYVFNNAGLKKSGFLRSVYVLVSNDGLVSWPVPDKLKTSCDVNIGNFPFDVQRCFIQIGSWVYGKDQVQYDVYKNFSIDLSEYTDNSEWHLVSNSFRPVDRRLGIGGHLCTRPIMGIKDGDDHIEFSDLEMELVIRRRSFFYVWNIILPCMMLSVLTLFSFRIPPDNVEKISMGLSVFLAFSMFMLLVAEQVPASGQDIPLIGLYITVLMFVTTVSVLFSVGIVNLNHRGSKYRPPPLFLEQLLIKHLAPLLGIATDITKASAQFKLAEKMNRRRPLEEAHCWNKIMKRKIKFFEDSMQFYTIEDELDVLWQQFLDEEMDHDPLESWLSNDNDSDHIFEIKNSNSYQECPFVTPLVSPSCSYSQFLEPYCEEGMLAVPESSRITITPSPSFQPNPVLPVTTEPKPSLHICIATQWKIIAIVLDRLFFYFFFVLTIAVYVYLFFVFPT